jgi:transposase
MNNQITIIRKEFRRSQEARYIHRLHGVLLVLLGFSTVKAGKVLGDPQRTVAHWVIQFRERGLDGLKDADKSGRPAIVNEVQQKALAVALTKPPREAGLNADSWTGQIISSFLYKHYKIKLSPRQCSRLLLALKNQSKA